MSEEKISNLVTEVQLIKTSMNSLIVEMKEDRAVTRELTKSQIELTSEMGSSRKIMEGMLEEVKEMRKVQNDMVARVRVIEASKVGVDKIKVSAVGTLISIAIGALIYVLQIKG